MAGELMADEFTRLMSDLSWLDELLPLMRCPVSKQPLRLATVEEKRAASLPIDQPALISNDARHIYPVADGIPILLPPDTLSTSH